MNTTGVLVTGVGGQGSLLASEITANAAIVCGYKVKTNEIHGMAQRGGSVVAMVKFGNEVHSPLIDEGEADVILSMEAIEALRYRQFLKADGVAIVSRQRVIPVTVSSGKAIYPEPEPLLNEAYSNLFYIDAIDEASKLGEPRAANVMLVGLMSTFLTLPDDAWRQAISKCVKPKAVDVNLKAFEFGKSLRG